MARKTKAEMLEEAKALGLDVNESMTASELTVLLAQAQGTGAGDAAGVSDEPEHPQVPEAPQVSSQAALDAQIERQVTQLGRRTAEKLRQCPQDRVIIGKDPLNEKDEYVVVSINGWTFQIKREVPVSLPEPVVKLLEQGNYPVRRAR